MKSLVVYHSQFGNTKELAETIHARLRAFGPSQLVRVSDVTERMLDGVDLLVVGGPTQGHGTSPAIKPFLDLLRRKDLRGMAGAAFDTRLKGPAFLWGSAAKPAAKTLERTGLTLVMPAESFLVKGLNEPQLDPGEIERARIWAAELAERATWVEAAIAHHKEA